MWTVVFLCSLAVVIAGAAIKFVTDSNPSSWQPLPNINGFEFVVGSILCAVLVIPLVTWAGFSIARGSQISYNEFWSGLEKKAYQETTTCHRDGSCRHTYDCDAYTVQVPHTRTDSKGNTSTYYTTEVRYHSCPYATKELSFYVEDTLGETYTFGSHRFEANPQKWRSRGLPDVPRGEPKAWVAVRERISSGNPGGTTKRAKYDNYILASQDDIYAKASSAIAAYKKAGVLPKVTTKIYDHYKADKVYGDLPPGAWQRGLLRLNGKIGNTKQGDLHLVLVDSSIVPNADEYTQALEAYWGSAALGKNTLSKNGLVIAVGWDRRTAIVGETATSADTVIWARAFTGMPQGNEALAVAVREQLTGVEAAPDELLPAIEDLVFAPDGYKRVQMEDFRYLFANIQPTGWQKFWTAFVAFILSMGVWVAALYYDVRSPISRFRSPTKEN